MDMEERMQKLKKEEENIQKQISNARWENTKLMWKYASWGWKAIIILGVIDVINILWKLWFVLYRFGQTLGQ